MRKELTIAQNELIENLMSDKDAFDAFVYTPWREALTELERRRENAVINSYLETLPEEIPERMKNHQSLVLFRNVATPNYEMYRFMACVDTLTQLQPLIFEYRKDKFNNRNDLKFALGKLRLHKKMNEKGKGIFEYARILDVNTSNNKALDTIVTHWKQNLVEFHHEIFLKSFPQMEGSIVDLSDWLKSTGDTASNYYDSFLALFLNKGILLENFLTKKNESEFTKKVILPALIHIQEQTGFKPLIIALDPPTMEGDDFWLSYPSRYAEDIDNKIK